MTTYRFKTTCPKCRNVNEIVSDQLAPTVCCGDCLMDRVEIVHLELSLLSKTEAETERV